ncbi:hypothetical protein DWB64_16140 [Fusibacter sp. A1]|nr:hypothetical protein DWB64_16140 [Fusibacter sp. A1]
MSINQPYFFRNIQGNRANRIHYSKEANQLHLITSNGLVRIKDAWSRDLCRIGYFKVPLKEVFHAQMCKDEEKIGISSHDQFLMVNILTNTLIKSISNNIYYSEDWRTYTTRIVKSIFDIIPLKLMLAVSCSWCLTS